MSEHLYSVRGRWPFPLDMLRYDRSVAATEEDGILIRRLSADHAPDRAAFLPVDIVLRGPNKPNTARWESFGWAVPGDIEHQMVRRWRDEERRKGDLLASAISKLTPEEAEVIREAIRLARGEG